MTSALYTYQPNESTIDYPGHIALVFFTQGCNFRCRYCHNPELLTFRDENMSYEALSAILQRAKSNWVDGVCITGGEPTLQEKIVETAAFVKKQGLDLKLDTQGNKPDVLSQLLDFCDYVAMDYKMPIEQYPSLIGVPVDVGKIQESLSLLKEKASAYEIRTTVIPGIHTEDAIRTMCVELEDIRRFVLQPFIPRDNLPDEALRTTEKTSSEILDHYASICRNYFETVVVR